MVGLTHRRIAQLCRDATLEAVKVGGRWKIDRGSAEAWIQERGGERLFLSVAEI